MMGRFLVLSFGWVLCILYYLYIYQGDIWATRSDTNIDMKNCLANRAFA